MSEDRASLIARRMTQRAIKKLWPSDVATVLEIAPLQYSESDWLVDSGLAIRVATMSPSGWDRTLTPRSDLAPRSDLMLFNSSISRVENLLLALQVAKRSAPYVMVYDNLMDPCPDWLLTVRGRSHVTYRRLIEVAHNAGLDEIDVTTGDYFGRWGFVHTPTWMHGLIARLTGFADAWAQEHVSVRRARHSCWLFTRRDG